MKRLTIVTDAWEPQVNGVVRTLQAVVRELAARGMTVELVTPADYFTVPCPAYPEIPLSLTLPRLVGRRIEAAAPDFIHIATEGPLGWAARHWCLAEGHPFTTSYHTRFPEYLQTYTGVPTSWSYAVLRHFHNAGRGCMVATASLRDELAAHGFTHLMPWSRGVDATLFRPRPEAPGLGLPRPLFLSVGRISAEKNLPAFLSLDLPGSKVVVGDGPLLASLKERHPDVTFLGAKGGEALAEIYAAADVFVFPSRSDTFGIVLLEALASGLPVAAFPVTGPIDVVGGTGAGVLDEDLRAAALAALAIPRDRCRTVGVGHSWAACADLFLANVEAAIKVDAAA